MDTPNTEKLVADMSVLIGDVEQLLAATAGQSGDKIAAARSRMEAALADARRRIASTNTALRARAGAAAESTNRYVHDYPWTAMGICAGAGLALGLLIGRR